MILTGVKVKHIRRSYTAPDTITAAVITMAGYHYRIAGDHRHTQVLFCLFIDIDIALRSGCYLHDGGGHAVFTIRTESALRSMIAVRYRAVSGKTIPETQGPEQCLLIDIQATLFCQ